MVDFSEEQEAEIQRRMEEVKRIEQYKVAGLTGYKICLQHLAGLVDQYNEKGELVRQGALDPFVLTVMQTEFERFKQVFFRKPVEEGEKKDGE